MTRTVYRARWVLPVTSAPIENGALVVDENGTITHVDSASAIDVDAQTVDLGEAALMPGLVNAHAHPELSILRGALEDLPFHAWIPRLRRIKIGGRFTADDWRDAARWSCAEAAAAGVTTMGATEDSDASMHALRDAGMRGIAYREVFAPSPDDAAAALARLEASIAEMRDLENDLVRVGISPHAPYTVCDRLFTAAAAFALRDRLPVAVHTAESETEHALVTRGEGRFAEGLQRRGIDTPVRARSTVALLERTGILATKPLLIHCVRVDDRDIAAMHAAGASVAHCPIANARLGHGVAPVTEMLEAGIATGLGSDSVASNNRIDMLEEARAAQIVQRARHRSPGALPANDLLRMATIGGARALGMDDRIGSLEAGKDADICAVSLAAPHAQPVFDPVAAVFMSARGSDVMLTAVRGRVIYRNGVHTSIDVERLHSRIAEMGSRVRAAAMDETIVLP